MAAKELVSFFVPSFSECDDSNLQLIAVNSSFQEISKLRILKYQLLSPIKMQVEVLLITFGQSDRSHRLKRCVMRSAVTGGRTGALKT